MTHSTLSIVASSLEVVGLFLLAREVFLAQKVEALSRGMEWAKQMLFLYTKKDFEGCYLLNRLDQGDVPARAREWVDISGPAAVKKAVEDAWDEIGARAANSIRRWEERTTTAVMKKRRWALWIGTVLLITAAILHFVNEPAT